MSIYNNDNIYIVHIYIVHRSFNIIAYRGISKVKFDFVPEVTEYSSLI